jgi:putative hydrolase
MGPGSPNPFGFDLNQFMQMLQSQGPVNWDVARQVSVWMATADPESGQPQAEPPIDRATVEAFERVVLAAQTAVAQHTGISQTLAVPLHCVNREGWASATIDGLTPVLESLARGFGEPLQTQHPSQAPTDPFAGIVGMMMPILLGVWSGSMIGMLAQQALGQYDLPLPLRGAPALRFVTRNVDAFAHEWSIEPDEMRYALALREVVHGAQRSVGWVRERLVRLASEYVAAYEVRPEALEDQLGSFDLGTMANLGEMPDLVGDPTQLLGAMRSERQTPMLEELQRFVSVLEGYTDVAVDELGQRMVPSFGRIDEALRRHRLVRGEAATFVDRLLGLELDREHYEQGVAFCSGVIERAGVDGLNRLWESESHCPTRPELEAPGLWLARLEL